MMAVVGDRRGCALTRTLQSYARSDAPVPAESAHLWPTPVRPARPGGRWTSRPGGRKRSMGQVGQPDQGCQHAVAEPGGMDVGARAHRVVPVSYTHLRAHE